MLYDLKFFDDTVQVYSHSGKLWVVLRSVTDNLELGYAAEGIKLRSLSVECYRVVIKRRRYSIVDLEGVHSWLSDPSVAFRVRARVGVEKWQRYRDLLPVAVRSFFEELVKYRATARKKRVYSQEARDRRKARYQAGLQAIRSLTAVPPPASPLVPALPAPAVKPRRPARLPQCVIDSAAISRRVEPDGLVSFRSKLVDLVNYYVRREQWPHALIWDFLYEDFGKIWVVPEPEPGIHYTSYLHYIEDAGYIKRFYEFSVAYLTKNFGPVGVIHNADEQPSVPEAPAAVSCGEDCSTG